MTELLRSTNTLAACYAVREGQGFLVFISGNAGCVWRWTASPISLPYRGDADSYRGQELRYGLPAYRNPHRTAFGRFYRIHPLHVVALRHVKGLEGKEVLIAGTRLFTTRAYRQQLAEVMRTIKK